MGIKKMQMVFAYPCVNLIVETAEYVAHQIIAIVTTDMRNHRSDPAFLFAIVGVNTELVSAHLTALVTMDGNKMLKMIRVYQFVTLNAREVRASVQMSANASTDILGQMIGRVSLFVLMDASTELVKVPKIAVVTLDGIIIPTMVHVLLFVITTAAKAARVLVQMFAIVILLMK